MGMLLLPVVLGARLSWISDEGSHFLCSQTEPTVHSIHNSLDFNAHCLWHIAHAPAVSSLREDDVDVDGCCDVERVGVVSSHLVLFSPFPLAPSTMTCFLWANFLWTCWWTMRNPIFVTQVFKYLRRMGYITERDRRVEDISTTPRRVVTNSWRIFSNASRFLKFLACNPGFMMLWKWMKIWKVHRRL